MTSRETEMPKEEASSIRRRGILQHEATSRVKIPDICWEKQKAYFMDALIELEW